MSERFGGEFARLCKFCGIKSLKDIWFESF